MILMVRDLLTNNLILLPTIEAKGETDDEDRNSKIRISHAAERKKTERGMKATMWEHGKVSKMCIFSLKRDFSLSRCLQHMRIEKSESVSHCFPAFRVYEFH